MVVSRVQAWIRSIFGRRPLVASLATIVLTSAVVGAVVSSMMNLLAQRFERDARHRELAFKSAMEAAYKRIDSALDLMQRNREPYVDLPDAPAFMATYYRWFHELLRTGKVPLELEKHEREFAELEAAAEKRRRNA